jgi:hypothetical protein
MSSDLQARMAEEEEAWTGRLIVTVLGSTVTSQRFLKRFHLPHEVTSKAFRLLVDCKEPTFSTERPGHGQAA